MTSSLIATSPLPGEAAPTMDADSYVERWLQNPDPKPVGAAAWPPAFAARAVERLKAEADRHWHIDPNVSLKLAGLIVTIGQERDEPSTTALGTMARGDALKFVGRTTEAWDALEQAGRMFQDAGDEVGWARTRIGRLYLSTMLNRVAEALADAERAREILVRRGEDEKLLRLLYQTAYVHIYLGGRSKARELYQSALTIAETLGEAGRPYLGLLYMAIGGAFESQGDLQQAIDYYERARVLFSAQGETINIANAEANIALLIQLQGHYRRALQLLHTAVARVAEVDDLETTKIKRHLFECYLYLNRYAEARELAREVVSDCRRYQDAFELARALVKLATAEAELENFAAAQEALDEAEAVFNSLGAITWAATARLRRGRIALQVGEARAAYQEAAEAADCFETNGERVNYATATLLKGQASLMLADLTTARMAGGNALSMAQRHNVPWLRYTSHLLLGQVAEEQSKLMRAARHYQAAAATTERVQRGLTITLRPGFLEDKGEALRRLIALNLRAGQVESAFEALEHAKSQVVLGYLANRERLRWAQDDAHSRALIEELDRLRGEHQRFYRLAHEPSLDSHHPGPVSPEQALAEVAVRERRMRAITEQLYFHTGGDEAVSPVPTVSVSQIQHKLDDQTLLIEFYNDGVHLWAFTLDRKTLAVHSLPVKVEDLNRRLAQLQMNMGAALNAGGRASTALTLRARTLLQRLYEVLVAPLGLESRECRRLVMVPYGVLHYLPFHLLFDGSAHLIERYEIVVLPAAGLATRPGPKREPGALTLANSWDGRLPHTQAEAQMVQRMFGGVVHAEHEATRTTLQAQPTQILHIAAHGQHRLDQPDLSFLQLADGQMYADDLLQQDLSYELVTLSACETGRANVAGSEELIGLGRGFLYAGAGALLLSLWPVVDATALRFMERMYQALRSGASKAAALRDAQRTLLAEAPQLHPAFWGAFQLVGDASPLSM